MPTLSLTDIDWEIVPRDVLLFECATPAGFPSPAEGEMAEPIDLGAWLVETPAASYVMRVDGYSMTGAGITDGDLIVVSRAVKPRPGSIVVALVHGDRTLKRLKKLDGRLWLVPEAEGYRTLWSMRMSKSGAWSLAWPDGTDDRHPDRQQ